MHKYICTFACFSICQGAKIIIFSLIHWQVLTHLKIPIRPIVKLNPVIRPHEFQVKTEVEGERLRVNLQGHLVKRKGKCENGFVK